jgi:transcriptional regulator with XRE-family HTH domain
METHFEGQEIRELFGKNLKMLRNRMSLSQMALSVRAGLAHNFVNDIENSKKWPSPETIAKLARVLSVKPGDFFQANPLRPPEAEKIVSYLNHLKEDFVSVVNEIKADYKLTEPRD